MLSNAVVAGVFAAAYVALVFLQVNPHLPLDIAMLWPLLAVVVGFYAVNATAIFYVAIVLRHLVVQRSFVPGWLSLRLLSWSSAASATAAAALMWWNLQGLRTALEAEAARRLGVGAVAMGLCATALLAIAVVHYSFGRRGSAVGVSLYVLAVMASVTLPLAARGAGQPRPLGAYPLDLSLPSAPGPGSSRVAMLLLDGASLDYVTLATTAGRLPNFGRVLDAGAAMHLATLSPTQPGPVWTTVATGQYPPRHGVISESTYLYGIGRPSLSLLPDHCFAEALVYLGFLDQAPALSVELRSRPLWSVLSAQGVAVGVVGWPLTHPAQPVRGFLVSDQFHLTPYPGVARATYPPDIAAVGAATIREVSRGREDSVRRPGEEGALAPPAAVAPIWRDRVYGRIADTLRRQFADVQFLAVRYRGLDLAGHRFFPPGTPIPFLGLADTRGDQQSLETYYQYVDVEVGAMLGRLGPNDLLLVVSGFGMEAVSVSKRVLARLTGGPDVTGTHENAPDGFLLAYGAQVEPGRRPRGSVVDVAPTVLYFMGVPVARDSDGVVRTDIFTASFSESHPIAFVPSHD